MNTAYPGGVDPVAARLLSTRANNCLDAINVSSLKELSEYDKTHDLSRVPRCGRRTLIELRTLLDRYDPVAPVIPGLEPDLQSDVIRIVFPERLAPGEPLPSVGVTMKQPMLDNLRDRMLAAHYETLVRSLTTRARNVLVSAHADHHSILGILARLKQKGQPLRNCGHKSSGEILKAFEGYKRYMESLSEIELKDLRLRAMSQDFPEFSEKQLMGFIEYEDREGRLPTLWMALMKIADSNARDLVFFDCYHGITRPKCNTTQLSFKFGLTAERSRQIVTSFVPDVQLAKMLRESAEYYVADRLASSGFVAMQPLCDRLNDAELRYALKPLEGHAAAQLFHIAGAGVPVEYEGKSYLLAEDIADAKEWKSMLYAVGRRVKTFSKHSVDIPSGELTGQFAKPGISRQENEKADKVAVAILTDLFEVVYDSSRDIFTLPPNAVDFEDALYSIIREAGRPMHISELADAFYKRYPRYAAKPLHSLKTYIFSSTRIGCLGKTSTYTLTEWGHATETFKTLIRRIVSESNRPLTVSEICGRLNALNRRTSNASIMTYLHLDRNYYSRFRGRCIAYGVAGRLYDIEGVREIDGEGRHLASFEEHLASLTEFISTYNALPGHSNGDSDEIKLARWLYNARCGKLRLSRRQIYRLVAAVGGHPGRRTRHNTVLQHCHDIYRLHEEQHRLPSADSEPELWQWLEDMKRMRFLKPQSRLPLVSSLLADLTLEDATV